MNFKKFIKTAILIMATGGAVFRQQSKLLQGGGSGGHGYVGGSNGTDHMVFFGDSIHLASMQPDITPTMTEVIATLDPGRVLTYDNECVGGSASIYCLKPPPPGTTGPDYFDLVLAGHPTAKYLAIAHGRNDIDTTTTEAFRSHMQVMIDRAIATGRIPVLPAIMYSLHPFHTQQALYNQVIIDLRIANNLPSGPDLYNWFFTHQDEISPDLSHPNHAGMVSINRLWAEAMLAILTGP